ncbi:MAG: aminotransferase class III-fold pyridoxal phosphate-dependent enzyme [Candidatus Adiutrix sp.]|jgi:taurine-pyruvate aminotransferase|nr:aminotransferase class III-fold pyridoxal phosphate-dependent enzyme [Candidatus Adiutrix sp.]
MNYEETDLRNIWRHLSRQGSPRPPIMAAGQGLRLTDINGREYLDAASGGVWCVNVGYGRAEIAEAVCAQMKRMPYYAATGGNLPTIEFSEKLLKYMPGLSRLYFSNSGSEANEKAYKMVRLKGWAEGRPERTTILYRHRDYHGTTIAALSSSGQAERRDGFGPLAPGFVEAPHACCYRCAFGRNYPGCELECARAVEEIIKREGSETVAGIVLETITAGGGIIVPVPEYYVIIQEICVRHGLTLIMDEVVCGLGRTGSMFAYQDYGLKPDIVTLAKGVASAYMPVSLTVTTEALFESLQGDERLSYFRDISTFGGCAAGATAALENLKIIENEKLLDNVRQMGDYLLAGLRENLDHPNVGDVRGRGLLAGLELVADKATKTPLPEEKVMAVCGEMAARGVLIGRTNRSLPGHNNIVNFAPAYIVTQDDLDIILKTLRESLRAVLGPNGCGNN